MGRVRRTFFVIAVSVLLLASIGSAARIVGTDGNDTLRGTLQADKLFGKKGNDKLYGLAGNDLIVPGAGRDKVYCGSGRDTVTADAADVVAKDCEVVKRPAPLPPPPPPPPPAPPPPPPPPAVAGKYVGKTSQNETVNFEVLAGGTSLRTFRLSDVNFSCQPPNLVSFQAPGTTLAPTPVTINADSTFAIVFSESGVIQDLPYKDDIRVTGRFSGTTASGAYQEVFSVDFGFVVLVCNAPNVTWTAALSP